MQEKEKIEKIMTKKELGCDIFKDKVKYFENTLSNINNSVLEKEK